MIVRNAYVPDEDGLYTAEVIVAGSSTPMIVDNLVADPEYHSLEFDLSQQTRVRSIAVFCTLPNGQKYAFEWWDGPEVNLAVTDFVDIKANEFFGGKGTADEPFLIANPRHLRNVNAHPEAHFRQIRDLDFRGACGLSVEVSVNQLRKRYKPQKGIWNKLKAFIKDETPHIAPKFKADYTFTKISPFAPFYNNGQGWLPILEAEGQALRGSYDGSGYSVNGVVSRVVNHSSKPETLVHGGLFGQIAGKIRDLTIRESCCFAVEAPRVMLGALCGALSGVASDCLNTGSLQAKGREICCGGLCGTVSSGLVRCVNAGVVNGEALGGHLGGIVGSLSGAENAPRPAVLSGCLNVGAAIYAGKQATVGGICGIASKADVQKCLNVGEVSFDSQLNKAGYVVGSLQRSEINRCFYGVANEIEGLGYTDFKVRRPAAKAVDHAPEPQPDGEALKECEGVQAVSLEQLAGQEKLAGQSLTELLNAEASEPIWVENNSNIVLAGSPYGENYPMLVWLRS